MKTKVDKHSSKTKVKTHIENKGRQTLVEDKRKKHIENKGRQTLVENKSKNTLKANILKSRIAKMLMKSERIKNLAFKDTC